MPSISMYKRQVSITLMALTIAAIVLFQAYWLRKSYEEEKKVFNIRTNQIFRETVFKLQAAKLHIDTAFDVRFQDRSGVINMTNVIRDQVTQDSTGKNHIRKSMIISMNNKGGAAELDSTADHLFRKVGPRIFGFLSGVDSLQEPITAEEISKRYAENLAREAIHRPFTIRATPVDKRENFLPSDSGGNRVVVGFTRPVSYQVDFGQPFWYIFRRVGPQALFSLLLVGGTIFSFLLLYRNWQQQRRLIVLKNDFISNMTHELKTPIATVSVAVEALRNFNALQDPVRTKEYLDISANELQRLSLLVDKVLKLSLFEREEIELRQSHFDLKLLVEEVIASMRLQFEKYGAKVAFRAEMAPAEGLPAAEPDYQIRADKLHITSVLFNLLDNALKYSQSDPSIQVELGAEPDRLILSVTDNGLGIAAAYQDRIFEKFFRVPTGDRHNVKGYGLGLSYVAYVLERQGGTISVDSREGLGSRFTVKIPRDHV